MTRRAIAISLLMFSYCFLHAQTMKSWTWSDYRIKFNAPDNLVVKESSSKVFYAGNENIFLTILPRNNENLTTNKMTDALQKWALESKLNFSSFNIDSTSVTTGYWFRHVDGVGYKTGMASSLLLLVDSQKPANSYYVWIQYQNGYAATVSSILNSFNPY